ncbi:RelA/SpoT domain protein [Peptoniphilus sp. oral taxon 375 str. F0436]|nr:RelA/SpoT domain protein [Peptoniphilus sp. oral taxon 375 str. F0436]
MELENIYNQFSKHLVEQLKYDKVSDIVKKFVQPYKKLMSYYTCAIMEVETKFNVLSEELSMQYDRNPIESIRTRLKSPESIREKMIRKGFPLTVESIEENLNDIAGVRIICSFPSDIYALADSLLKQDDIHLIEKKTTLNTPRPMATVVSTLLLKSPSTSTIPKR